MNNDLSRIYLCAICGTAMASLAGMLKQSGFEVNGSDNAVYPPMSTFLQRLGIPVFEGFAADNIRQSRPDLVVIGNTLSRGNPEVEFVLDAGIRYASMAETVQELFIRGRRSIVVSGTHGKTTTTALIAWLLESARRSPSFLVGGMAANFDSSFGLGTGPDFVIEGDEYDTAFFDKGPKFMHYMPRIALVKNIEFDHADIYDSVETIQKSFSQMMRIVPPSGLIVAGADSPRVMELMTDLHSRATTFGIESGEWRAESITVDGNGTAFDVVREARIWEHFHVPLIGAFNVQNALGAVIVANELGLTVEEIRAGLASFKGVRRRLEVRGTAGGITVYDDFAHHPTAVDATLQAIRTQYPDSRIWAVFEPRSQTARRRVFESQFAAALAHADIAIVAPPYTTSHLDPDAVIRPDAMVQSIQESGIEAHHFGSVPAIVEFVRSHARTGDRIVVMSNGGFENIHQRLLDAITGRD